MTALAKIDLPPGEYPGVLKAIDGIEYSGYIIVAPSGNASFQDEYMDFTTHIDGPAAGENPYIEYVRQVQ